MAFNEVNKIIFLEGEISISKKHCKSIKYETDSKI